MAEASALIGLVSSIITFVYTAEKTVSRLRDFYGSGRGLPKVYANVKNQLVVMVPVVEEMNDEHAKGLIPPNKAVRLKSVLETCIEQTTELNVILDDVLPASTDTKRLRSRKAIRSLRRKIEIVAIESLLESSKATFTLYYVRHPVSLQSRPQPSWLDRRCDIPVTSVLHFVGRRNILQQIDKIFEFG